MAMPRQAHPCTCEDCRAAQRVSAMILSAATICLMINAICAALIFA